MLLLCCIGALCFWCCRRKRRENSEERLVTAECNSRGLSPPCVAPASATAEAATALEDSCQHCGNKYLEDAIFCRRCGHRRGRQGATPEMNTDAKQRCKRAFALIDKNGNGTLSRIEVIKACRERG